MTKRSSNKSIGSADSTTGTNLKLTKTPKKTTKDESRAVRKSQPPTSIPWSPSSDWDEFTARDTIHLFKDSGRGGLPDSQFKRCHRLLNVAGVPLMEDLGERIVWVAKRWLGLVTHSGGCQCIQCVASRKIIYEDNAHDYRS